MLLAMEVLGALIFGASLSGFVNPASRQLTTASVTLLAVAAMAIAFWSGVWSEGSALVTQHDSDAALTVEEANTLAGNLWPANNAFITFAAATIPTNAKVYLYCGPGQAACLDGVSDWVTFRLSPRVFVEHPGEAQWVVVYGAPLADAPFRFGDPLRVYAAGYATGRRL